MAITTKIDRVKLKAEQDKKDRLQKEKESRQKYFAMLKNDVRFQKYVMDEIINAEIKENQTLPNTERGLNLLIKSTDEQVKSMLLAKIGALKTAQNIKQKITSNF